MTTITPGPKAAKTPQEPKGSAGTQKLWSVGTLTYTTAGLIVLFCWLLWGDFAWSLKERSVNPVVQILLKKYGASDLIAGVLIGTLPQTLAMFIAPIVSYKSDRFRSRWGRRIPFLIIPAPIAAVCMIALAFSPMLGTQLHAALGSSSPGLNTSVLIVFGVFWTLFEFATITANSVISALINDVVPRPLLGRFYGLFRALSLIAGMAFSFWLLGKAEAHYLWIFIGIGTLYGVGFTVMCLNVKEGQYPPPPPVEPGQAGGFVLAARTYFKECFSNRCYGLLFIMHTFAGMAFASINLFSVFFARSLKMDMGVYGKYITLTYFISLILSYFLGSLADKFHPLRVGLTTLVLYAAATLWGGLFVRDATTFGIALVFHGVISGTFMTVTASLPQRLFPQPKFAQFYSAMILVTHLGVMMVGPVVGFFLDCNYHAYRYTYLASFGLTLLTLAAGLLLHSRFMALGGPKGYVAPE